MRPIPFLLTVLILSIATVGAMTVKSRETNRTTFTTVYVSTSEGTTSLTANSSIFDDASISCAATLTLDDESEAPLYKNSNLSTAVKVED